MIPRAALVLLVLVAPTAAAVDLLTTEVRFAELEARVLVRSLTGEVRLSTEPAVLAAGVAPGALPDALRPAPITIPASHAWRGIEGIVEIVLRRDDPAVGVDIVVEDGPRGGVWLEWPRLSRPVPAPAPLAGVLALLLLVRAGRASGKGFGRR